MMMREMVLDKLIRGRPPGRAVVGFDGFVDQIARCGSGPDGAPITTMAALGRALIDRGEMSFTIPLAHVRERSGGNAPNMADALSRMEVETTCIGTLGEGAPHRAFEEMSGRCELISYGRPGACLALEFDEAKLFLADGGHLDSLGWREIVERIGGERILSILGGADVIALLNWGEMSRMQEIWEGLLSDAFPRLPPRARTIFVDPSDMGARTDAEIGRMADALARLGAHGSLVLSVNSGEMRRLASALGIPDGLADAQLKALCAACHADAAILHTQALALAAAGERLYQRPTRFAEAPALLTGGGDSFNAGVVLGLLHGLDVSGCLMIGNAASGHHVRNGRPPDKRELIAEIKRCAELWP